MQIVIDIPEEKYHDIVNMAEEILDASTFCSPRYLYKAVLNGTPLDSIKAEIAENICLTDNPYTKETTYTIEHLKLLDILDNIGEQKGVRRNDS